MKQKLKDEINKNTVWKQITFLHIEQKIFSSKI